jgi:hypothetical protein
MRPTCFAFAAALAALTLTSPLRAQAPDKALRFRDPASITGDPTGMRQIVPFQGPRYPDYARAHNQTAAPVVAFVVDTTGVIELPTASFLDGSRSWFRESICEMLPQLRFEPLVVDGRKMRVLVAQFYAFRTAAAPDSAGIQRARALMKERQMTYATQPVANVVSDLERRPHCDNPKEK